MCMLCACAVCMLYVCAVYVCVLYVCVNVYVCVYVCVLYVCVCVCVCTVCTQMVQALVSVFMGVRWKLPLAGGDTKAR